MLHAHLLSKQDNFCKQESLLEQKIKARKYYCMFLLKFHCELNPIEMVCSFIYSHILANYWIQYWGWYKQQYRDVPKDWLDVAKWVTCECLDKCPVEVI